MKFVWVFVFCPIRDFIIHVEKSPLLVKASRFWHTRKLQSHKAYGYVKARIDVKLYYCGEFLLCDVIMYQMHVNYEKC